MENCFKSTFSKAIFVVLFLLIASTILAGIFENYWLLQLIVPLFIPAFSFLYFTNHKKLSIPFTFFLVFSFFGDITPLILGKDFVLYVTSTLYFLGVIYLIFMVLPSFKMLEVPIILLTYSLVMLFIGLYFLNLFRNALQPIVTSDTEIMLFTVKNLALILLGLVSFGIYLETQTNRSIYFLLGVMCFGFSSTIDYVNMYYLSDISFMVLRVVLYAVGLYFIFKYSSTKNNNIKRKALEDIEIFSPTNVMA